MHPCLGIYTDHIASINHLQLENFTAEYLPFFIFLDLIYLNMWQGESLLTRRRQWSRSQQWREDSIICRPNKHKPPEKKRRIMQTFKYCFSLTGRLKFTPIVLCLKEKGSLTLTTWKRMRSMNRYTRQPGCFWFSWKFSFVNFENLHLNVMDLDIFCGFHFPEQKPKG
jgi:hypothetical protein